MNEIFQFLKNNPLVLVILVAWIAGALGNIAKAVKKSRERAAKAQQPTRVEPPVVRHEPRRAEPTHTGPTHTGPHRTEPRHEPQPIRSEEIAAEMRRILRQQAEPTAGDGQPMQRRVESPPPLPSRPRQEPRPAARPRNIVVAERPPAPVMPSTSSRRLQLHGDSHVGEGIARRASVRSGHVGELALGQLGGRVHDTPSHRTAATRYALDDLKRVIVLNEILGLPLALRGTGGREV